MIEPKIRFKKDDGSSFPDWEKISFDTLYEPLNNNTYSRDCLNYEDGETKNIHYGDILTKFGEICDVQKEKLPFVNEGNPIQKYVSLQNGDIVLADTAEDETVGKAIEIYNVGDENIISGLHTMACRPRVTFAPKYLGYYMNSFSYHDQLKPYMQGIKVTSIGRKNIAETTISYPTDEKEQQKIADFLSDVDEVIAASEEEVANLEQQKKGMMQKIFSQEVRFKKADGSDFPDWEEKTLGECCKITTGKLDANAMVENGKYDFYTSGIAKYKIDVAAFEGPAITIAGNGATVGYLHLADGKFNAYQRTYVLTDFTELREYLYLEISNKLPQKIRREARAGNIPYIVLDMLTDLKILIPHPNEQQLIADFLTSYDEAITAAKQELEKWKELKKGLLQQMFV